MTDADAEAAGDTDPEDAFALVGNATRAAILRALAEAGWEAVSFSTLRSRVDADMDSGRFNYHLDQLVEHFIERTEDGYRILPQGMMLYRVIRSGTFNRRTTLEPFDAGFDCYFCGARAQASYDEGMFEVGCPDCEHVYSYTYIPPSAVEDADPADSLARVDQYNRHHGLACVRGVCPYCVHEMHPEFMPGSDIWLEDADRYEVFIRLSCEFCGNQYYVTVGQALLYHPTVVGFLDEQGVDVAGTPHWEFPFAMTDRTLSVRSRDPWEVSVTVTAGDAALEVVVDEELSVAVEGRS